MTLTLLRVSPKVRSMKLECRIRWWCSAGKRRYAVSGPGRDAGPVRDHVGRVSERGEQPGQDRLAQGVTLSQSWLNAMLS